MRVYLVAESSGRTAFKISTAHVYSTLENMIRQQLHISITNPYWRKGFHLKNSLLHMAGFNVYYTELDGINTKARKLKEVDWKAAVKAFIKEYPGEIEKAEEIRKGIGK